MSKTFTLEDKKRFNGTVEHVEDVDSKPNTKPKFVDVDEKVLLAEGEDKVHVALNRLTTGIDTIMLDHTLHYIRMYYSCCCGVHG